MLRSEHLLPSLCFVPPYHALSSTTEELLTDSYSSPLHTQRTSLYAQDLDTIYEKERSKVEDRQFVHVKKEKKKKRLALLLGVDNSHSVHNKRHAVVQHRRALAILSEV